MSEALVCLNDNMNFYSTDSNFTYNSFNNDNMNENCISLISDDTSNICNNTLMTNSANLLSSKNICRKREASNDQCIDSKVNSNSNVPFECDCQIGAKRTNFNGKGIVCRSTENLPDSLENMDFSDSSSVADSGIECSKDSPAHVSDVLSACYLEEIKQECKKIGSCTEKILLHLPHTDLPSTNNKLEIAQESKHSVFYSLFETEPPMIRFVEKNGKVTSFPDATQELMKWKLSSITPIVIKQTITKIGFTLVDAETSEYWLGTWGKHPKSSVYKHLKYFQKINHYPGGFHLGRKDRFLQNYNRMLCKFGSADFNFFPETYQVPMDLKVLKQAWVSDREKCWIVKPCASARGTGVKVIYKWSQVPKKKPFIVQRYISNPYLINGSKFDLRLYVMVSSVEPLRVYLFQDGLVRFASEKYSLASTSFSNRFIHLTNYSINKNSSTYTSNDDKNMCQGHKWSLKSFWTYMSDSGIDVDKIQESIIDMIIKTIISVEGPMCRMLRHHAKSSYNCFEVFGFDVMLDKNLHPWLLEINISPGLHTKSKLDSDIKGPMVKDMLNIAGFELPSKSLDILGSSGFKHKPSRNHFLSTEEMEKHALYTYKQENVNSNILDKLTPDDIQCLMDNEDELCRCGSFTRIFPTHLTDKYFPFFDYIRYYNVLLHAWEKNMHTDRTAGIQRLQDLSSKLTPPKYVKAAASEASVKVAVEMKTETKT